MGNEPELAEGCPAAPTLDDAAGVESAPDDVPEDESDPVVDGEALLSDEAVALEDPRLGDARSAAAASMSFNEIAEVEIGETVSESVQEVEVRVERPE